MYIVAQVRDVVDVPLVLIKQNNLQSVFQTLKKNYKLCDSNTLTSSNRSTLYVYGLFFLF